MVAGKNSLLPKESFKASSISSVQFSCSVMSDSLRPHEWEIDGETVEKVSDFILGGSKITAEGDCSHEIKRRYSLEGKL